MRLSLRAANPAEWLALRLGLVPTAAAEAWGAASDWETIDSESNELLPAPPVGTMWPKWVFQRS